MSVSVTWLADRFLQEGDEEAPTMAPTLEEGEIAYGSWSAILSNVFLFFLIFGLSATVRVQDLKHQLTNKFAIFTGVAMQFLIMPFLGFCSVMFFKEQGFTQAMGISLLVVTASPGGSYSNWWCSLFNAELALSVAMTSVSSVISVGLLPANLFVYSWLAYSVVDTGGDDDEDLDVIANLDFTGIFISLGVVLVGIVLGLFVGYKYNDVKFKERANKLGSTCGLLLILVSVVFGSGAGDSDTNFWSLPWSFYIGTALPCILGMTLANIISRSFRLSPPETVAISIECCYQNTAIATSVAVTMFSDPNERTEAIAVPLLYGLVEAIIIGCYCVWAWKVGWTKAPADEKLCVVVTSTYEAGANQTEEVEWEGELPEGFVARLFVPKAVEERFANGDSKGGPATPRGRLESAEVSDKTKLAAPPGTPDTILESSVQEQDLEAADDSISSEDETEKQDVQKTNLYAKYADPSGNAEDGYPTDEQSQSSSLADNGTAESPKQALPASPSKTRILGPTESTDADDEDAELPRQPSFKTAEA